MKSRTLLSLSAVLLFSLLSSGFAVAEEINFYCKGIAKGRLIADSPSEFNLLVKTAPPELWMPGYITGCVLLSEKYRKNFKGSCEMTSDSINCSCSGGGAVEYSMYSLSSLSGVLKVHQVYAGEKEKDATNGRFECKRIEKKVF